MIIAEFLPAAPHVQWQYALQMGVRHAICKCAPELTVLKPPWDLDALRTIQQRFTAAGLTLYGLEGDQFDMRRIKLGLDGRDDDLELYCRMLRNMGALGIPLLCYNFMAGIGWHRTHGDVPTRGGALTSRFDAADIPSSLTEAGAVSEERMWENYAYFIRRVMPVAEQAGVRMGMHPDDPPLPSLRGIARILSKPENFERAMALAPSPYNGVTFCQANFKLMGCDVIAWARRFGEQKKIFFIHFRDVRGTAQRFEETFHDDGPTDMPALLKLYHELGFAGPVRVDHVPTLAGETNDQPGYGSAAVAELDRCFKA
ncbi:MAG: mannonate dehydratase, partial [Kiritimatiellaeota bacterium]|nr:mannonate dehydratase [Kiritimatiellota bacterium]